MILLKFTPQKSDQFASHVYKYMQISLVHSTAEQHNEVKLCLISRRILDVIISISFKGTAIKICCLSAVTDTSTKPDNTGLSPDYNSKFLLI